MNDPGRKNVTSDSTIHWVEVRSARIEDDYLGSRLLADFEALGITGVERAETAKLYFLRGDLDAGVLSYLCAQLLADPVTETARWWHSEGENPEFEKDSPGWTVFVGLLPGVTDTVADNLLKRARIIGIDSLRAASTGHCYRIVGDVSEEKVHLIARRLLCNPVIQHYELDHFHPHVGIPSPQYHPSALTIPLLQVSEQELTETSRDRLLSLDLVEMKAIQRYFRQQEREPTDVELECLAQTWSEHCVHKTFMGTIEYEEYDQAGIPRQEHIDSLLKSCLRAATEEINAPWVRSAFVDNAGIIDFSEDYEISFKVETHNHPSALEPFGGANTGVGGVVRDIIGVSARPIANTDVLCFGPLDTAFDDLPSGVLHPRRVYNGVVSGIEDYGNKMGIPTVNGAILFDEGYVANPLVYCGCVGIAPVGAHPREASPGDLVVVLGGRTGRDGLHGATFSSAELTHETGEVAAGAVQIGNPITEKITLDAILVARDERLYTAITDCGAGGLSSAVSEMGQEIGATVYLDQVPLKYQGLQPWEIWLSEAQERMVLAVPRENVARLQTVCEGRDVEMTVIGEFTGDRELILHYGDDVVARLEMSFLHDGLPRRHMKATWRQKRHPEPAILEDDLSTTLLDLLAEPDVRSKEDVVRRYDHEVQGATVIKPFVGFRNDGPSDAAVLRPLEVADSFVGIAIGCGINPHYGLIDPYAMAVSAIDEAIRNVVAVGADPTRIAILDNFCWGNPQIEDRLGGLVRAAKGCHDEAVRYGTPFISGKDSLNNEYLDGRGGRQVAIPPSLLISAIGIVPDVRRCVTSDLKTASSLLYVLGETKEELGGSAYYRLHGMIGNQPPTAALAGPGTAWALHQAIDRGLVLSAHDCSEGGLGVALAEMAIGGELGVEAYLKDVPGAVAIESPAAVLLSESNGRYIVEVRPEDREAFEATMKQIPHGAMGTTKQDPSLAVFGKDNEPLLMASIAELRRAWRGPLEEGA
ncbi:MAG: phosphoribosylformylglycinamidine synthase subunit PurL [Chloroflexota bacterium]